MPPRKSPIGVLKRAVIVQRTQRQEQQNQKHHCVREPRQTPGMVFRHPQAHEAVEQHGSSSFQLNYFDYAAIIAKSI